MKDAEAHRMAVELASRTGKSLTQVVKDALREALERSAEPPGRAAESMVARALEIARRSAARPVVDSRTPDEILGYGEDGAFSG
ncbi:MAG: type II toxin-antitoxin system VapB family antitoxin [Bryobacteraceae bacterium]